MERVTRIDVGRLDKFERTPSGGLRIPARIGRIGVQSYQTADGGVVRELRLPEEVFAPESVASFADAAVTDLHPAELVTPATWKRDAVGAVKEPRAEGNFLAATLVVSDAEEIRRIEGGEREEVSSGYTCDIEARSGVYDGEPYDVIQRNIRGNHAALGPRGWGRAGPDVALRLDAARQVIGAPPAPAERNDGMTTKRFVRIDGYEFEAGSDSHLQAVDRRHEKITAELAAATKAGDEQRGRADALEAKAKGLETELAAAKTKLDAASSPDELDKRVEARLAVIDRARRVLGAEYTGAGKTDAEIMRAALDKAGVEMPDEVDDSYLAGAFGVATKGTGDGDEGGGGDEEAEPTEDGGGAKKDAKDKPAIKISKADRADTDLPGLEKVRKDNADFYANAEERFAMRRS